MEISPLVDRFEFYATNLIDISHDPASRRNRAFMHLDIEDLQLALSEGIHFPALFLQTPEVEKQGASDNIIEQFSFTFTIVLQKTGTKAALLDSAKKIADKIYNLLLLDIADGVLPGSISGTNEGILGPMGDGLYGWAVSLSISDGYDGEIKQSDWKHL